MALVIGDPIELQQVLLNLIMNAKEAMSAVDDHVLEITIRTEQVRQTSFGKRLRHRAGVDEAG